MGDMEGPDSLKRAWPIIRAEPWRLLTKDRHTRRCRGKRQDLQKTCERNRHHQHCQRRLRSKLDCRLAERPCHEQCCDGRQHVRATFNLVNQMRMMQESALGKITSGDTGLGDQPYQCSDGTEGRGTQGRPCVSYACTLTNPGDAYPQGCFASWFVTPDGRTVAYVSHPNETIYVTGTPVPEPVRIDAAKFIQLNQETAQ